MLKAPQRRQNASRVRGDRLRAPLNESASTTHVPEELSIETAAGRAFESTFESAFESAFESKDECAQKSPVSTFESESKGSNTSQVGALPTQLQRAQLQQEGAQAPKEIPLPEGLSDVVKNAATRLWKKYAGDPKVALHLESELEASLFDPMVGAVNDDYRMGMLMRAIPLDDTPVKSPFEKLSVTTLVVETATEHKVKAPLDLVKAALASNPKADILLAPEWLFVPPGRFHSQQEMQKIVKELVKISSASDALLVPGTIAWVDDDGAYHNTALALDRGKIVKTYDKRNDGDDEDFAKAHGATYARGSSSALFEWKGRTVALEVCRDHGDGRARWDLEDQGQPTVDLQLVVSCGVDLKHAAVGMGGIALVANGDKHANVSGEFSGGRRVPLEDGDHPRFVRTEVKKRVTTSIGGGVRVRTITV